MMILRRLFALVLWPFRFTGRGVLRAARAVRSLRQPPIRINIWAGRSVAAPWWRKGTRGLVVLIGIGIYFGLQLGLAQMIHLENYQTIGTILVVAITIIVTLYSPPAAFIGWLILSPWVMLFWQGRIGGYIPINFDRMALLLIFVVVVVRLLVNRWPVRRWIMPEVLLFGSYFWLKLTPYLGTRPPIIFIASIILEAMVMPFFIYYIAKLCIRSKEQIARCAVAIVLMGLLWALTGVYEHFTGKMWLSGIVGYNVGLALGDVGRGRAMGPTFHMYVYGGVLILTILMAAHLGAQSRKKASAIFYHLVVGVAIVALFWGFARGAYIAFFVVALLLPIVATSNRTRYLVYVMVLATLVVVAYPRIMASADVNKRISNTSNIYARLIAHRTLWRMIGANFWTGVGFDKSQQEMANYVKEFGQPIASRSKTGLTTYSHGHNEYLTVFAEQGVVGFVTYFGAVVGFLVQLFRMRRKLPAEGYAGRDFLTVAILFVIGYMVLCTSDHFKVPAYAYINFVVWSVIGLAVRLGELGQEEAARAECLPEAEPAAALRA